MFLTNLYQKAKRWLSVKQDLFFVLMVFTLGVMCVAMTVCQFHYVCVDAMGRVFLWR